MLCYDMGCEFSEYERKGGLVGHVSSLHYITSFIHAVGYPKITVSPPRRMVGQQCRNDRCS